ncbi:alginate lyase family protein [Agrococcus baldri]|uniref:Heparin-sulfate lyase N-terminal domain-containing protein n=1 Tax=Agrococcus baldri TaxID=153730 RepID=A0AA87URQ0_9MICO|nr:alginate lyase family protein [Agrococcus baldri]GEK79695.1 hypothetical protein ABA31_10460 [Agrococcus baldri]
MQTTSQGSLPAGVAAVGGHLSSTIEQRLEAVASLDPHAADVVWQAISECGSQRLGRPIEWPVAEFLKHAQSAALQAAEGYQAEARYEPVPLPIVWDANPFRDKPWINRLMCLQPMDVYILAWRAGDQQWLRPAADIYFSWCDFHIVQRKRAYLSWYDMPVGYRALKTALLADCALEGSLHLSIDERRLLVASAEAHMNELMRSEAISQGNHGIFQMHGLAVLAEMFWSLPQAPAARTFAASTMSMLTKRQFNDEGVHLEHSPHYHQWMMRELASIEQSGWFDLDLTATLRRAEEVRGWLMQPDGEPVRVGDTPIGTRWPSATSSSPDFQNDLYRLRWYRDGGYAICRTESGQLFFQGSYHSTAHKHADDLSFELFDRGRRILVDSGSTGYSGGPDRVYFLSSAAHNTIEVDGTPHPRNGTDAYGSSIRKVVTADHHIELTAYVNHKSRDWTHERHLRWYPGGELVIQDDVRAESSSVFGAWLHLAPAFERRVGSLFCDQEIHVEVVSRLTYSWHRGEVAPMRGWRAGTSGQKIAAWSGRAILRGTNAQFFTQVMLSGNCDCDLTDRIQAERR